MLKIGMIGESPTDTTCIASLLNKKYKSKVEFFPIIEDIRGSDLENQKIKRLLRKEFEIQKPDIVLFIRDLDALENNLEQQEKRKQYFSEFNSVVDKRGILLVNIFELEALLLADIKTLCDYFQIEIFSVEDCMKVENPKEYVASSISEYDTSDNKRIFSQMQYEVVVENCRYFKKFDEYFSKVITSKN